MPENCAAIIIAAKHHELIKVKDTRGTTNTVGALRCKFQFRTEDWLHSAKTAMFCNGDAVLHPEVINGAISVPLDADDECPVPYEVLTDTLPYSVGVWGITDTGLRVVSNWLVFNAQVGCYTEGNAPGDPEQTVYDEIRLISQEAVDAANEVVQRANSGEFDGKSAYELAVEDGFEGTVQEWLDSLVGVDGKDGYTPIKGVDYSDGKDGKDGYTPIKGVDYFDGVNGKDGYTPIKGVDYFDGKDGANGKDGYTPIKGVDYFDGKNGVDGKDGYTPVKGVDYFDGKDGVTPTIEISNDGYWIINGVKTEYKAVGTGGAPESGDTIPTIAISDDGYWVINGEKTEHKATGSDGKDGVDGKDGYTPIKGVDYFDGAPGTDGKDGKDGQDGYTPIKDVDYFDGKAGYTPVKGVDYYTEQEKQALSDAILDILKNTVKSAKIGAVTLLADAWTGEGNLYSQVVSIEGVTENSQVDLTPDVQQLAVFYEKDLAFVTENEGGVVTVYAIGQKPTNDYTIQVTITEVDV